ncbi:PP2C family protein-serine/threonine phosphatase [Geodermatophilus sp. SYSU D00742]
MGPDGGRREGSVIEGHRGDPDTGRVRSLRATESDLSRTVARYERVLANVADGIYGLDAEGRVEFVNPAAVRMTGHSAADQLGLDQHELLHGVRPDGSPYPKEECPVWRALRTGRTIATDGEVFWRRDGSAVPVELIAVPTVEDDTVTGVVVSFRDLTDRLAAQRQAAELHHLAERATAQRALSDRLQQALLTPPPEPDHLHIAVRYRPAAHEAQVGGDWYDAFLQPDGATMLVIGDVVGHDSTAAAAMGQLRGLLRALAYDNDEPPSATLTRAEHAAVGLAVSNLATVVLARIERRPDVPVSGTRVLRWSNAGHLPPVLLAPDGSTTLLDTRPDLMLGVDPDAPRTDHTAELRDGATLLLVTDGLVERRDADLDQGLVNLREALRDLGRVPLEELCDTLLARMLPVAGADDVALVAVRAYPEDRPRPPEAGPNRLPPGMD